MVVYEGICGLTKIDREHLSQAVPRQAEHFDPDSTLRLRPRD